MKGIRHFLLCAAFIACVMTPADARPSQEAMEILVKIGKDLEGELSSGCQRSAQYVFQAASQSDALVFQVCDFTRTFGKSLVRSSCSNIEYRKIESAACGTDWPVKVQANFYSGLSESTKSVLQNILNRLIGISDTCMAMFKAAAEADTTEYIVSRMCEDISNSKASMMDSCSEVDYYVVRDSACDELRKHKEEMNRYTLSSEASSIFNNIKANMDSFLSADCGSMVSFLPKIANSDVEIYGMCNLMKSSVGETITTARCSNSAYERLVAIICDELKAEGKIFGEVKFRSGLSEEAKTVFQNMLDDVYGLTDSCMAFYSGRVERVEHDDVVFGMCGAVSEPQVRDQLLTLCSEDDYDTIKYATCNEIERYQIQKSIENLSDANKDAVMNIRNKLEGSLSEECRSKFHQIMLMANSDTRISTMCQFFSMPQGKDQLKPDCSQAECDRISQTICDEL